MLELQIKYIVTWDTVGLGPPRWDVLPNGEWMPTIMMKSKGRDSLEAFDDSNPRHRKWEHDNGVGFNWSVATLCVVASVTLAPRPPHVGFGSVESHIVVAQAFP